MQELKNKLDEIFCEVDRHYYSGVIEPLAGKELLKMIQQAIDYIPCCKELPMIEELIISEIRRKHQKQVDDELERFLSGNETDCRLRGFFSEPDLNE